MRIIFAASTIAILLFASAASAQVTITSPADRTEVATGSMLDVRVSVPNPGSVAKVVITTPFGVAVDSSPPFEAMMEIPANADAGIAGISAFAVLSNGEAQQAEGAFTVVPSAAPTAISLAPSVVSFQAGGQSRQLRVTGTFADGVERDLTHWSGVAYSSTASGVASVDADGIVRSAQTGTAIVNARVGSLTSSTTAQVDIAVPNRAPVAIIRAPQGPVDVGARILLDGGRSFDLDRQPLDFRWRQTAGTPVTFQADSKAAVFASAATVNGAATLELRVTDSLGAVSTAQTEVEFARPPANGTPGVTFSASAPTVAQGQSVTLTWDSDGVSRCVASGGWQGEHPVSGSYTVTNLSADQAFRIACSGPYGAVASVVSVTVSASSAAVTIDFTAPNSVTSGSNASLTWTTTGATSCEASGGWSGARATSGTASAGPVTSDTVFVLRCSGANGVASISRTVFATSSSGSSSSSGGSPAPSSSGGGGGGGGAFGKIDLFVLASLLLATLCLRRLRGFRSLAPVVAAAMLSGCGADNAGSTKPAPSASGGPISAAPDAASATPLATEGTWSTIEDTLLRGSLQGADPQGGAVQFIVVQQPSGGVLTLTGSGPDFTYQPATDYFGPVQFKFVAKSRGIESAITNGSINVIAANDAPRITALNLPTVADEAGSIPVNLACEDVDGVVREVTITTTTPSSSSTRAIPCGPVTLRAPATGRAIDMQVDVVAIDNEGATSAPARASIRVTPVKNNGRLRTLKGRWNGAGVHLLVLGDGFTRDEQRLLHQVALRASNSLALAGNAQLPYDELWNVHVFDVDSVDSGIDDPALGLSRNTAFDTSYACLGLDRAICGNRTKVLSAATESVPHFDQVVVLVNSTKPGGAASGSVSYVSISSGMPRTLLHELGHTHAGLADEYVDSSTAEAGGAGAFVEGMYPNVTINTTPARIPWHLWIADTTNIPRGPQDGGIGLYEGAFYAPVGYYRPALTSFMRESNEVVPSVHAEAWASATYRRSGGPVRGSALPAAPTINAPINTSVTFEVRRILSEATQAIYWQVNGVEVAAARNQEVLVHACCTSTQTPDDVRVTVLDATGNIRRQVVGESAYVRNWQVVPN
jgi:hypothetical protein